MSYSGSNKGAGGGEAVFRFSMRSKKLILGSTMVSIHACHAVERGYNPSG